MRIGELSKAVGIPASTIRYYEQLEILPIPDRQAGNRVYDESSVQILQAVKLAKDAGFRLDEIRAMQDAMQRGTPTSVEWNLLAQKKLDEINSIIYHAQVMKAFIEESLKCDCKDPTNCPHVCGPLIHLHIDPIEK